MHLSTRAAAALSAALFLVAGCTRLGEPLRAPSGAGQDIRVGEVLNDLSAGNDALHNFHASGRFLLKAPELEAAQVLRQSSIDFAAPDRLRVTGRKYSKVAFRLIASGDRFLLEFPTEKQYIYGDATERPETLPENVSPARIAREMFLEEDWARLGRERVRLAGEAPESQQLTIDILGAGDKVHRRIQVEGPPWVIVRSELFDEAGQMLATTMKSDHRVLGGYRFPASVESRFPSREAYMSFQMNTIELNVDQDPALYDVDAARADLERRGYVRVTEAPAPGEIE